MFRSLRFALRQLRHSPGFALTAVLTLALGIGATTAIFSVLDAVLLEPLPFPQPDRLVAIATVPDAVVSVPTVQDWQRRGRSFSSIAAYRGWSPTIRTAQGNQTGRVLEVTQNFLSTLGVGFASGGDLPQTGNERDCSSQAVVSYGFWNRLGGGAAFAGRTLSIDGHTFEITGVLRQDQPIEGGAPLNQPEIVVPIACDPSQHPEERGNASWLALGRMRPGVSLAAASADLARVHSTLERDYPNDYHGALQHPPQLTPLVTLLTGTETRPALLATLAACALLLVIACANLASLLLARNTRRRAEFATRATLGATVGQLLQQLLVESAVLALGGGAAGLALGLFAVRMLQQARSVHLPRLSHAALNPRVAAFILCVTLAVTLLLALLPARRTLRAGLLADLGSGTRNSASEGLRFTGRLLVAGQITLTMILVACAGWMIASVHTLLHQPLGFAPDHLLLAGVDVHGSTVAPTDDGVRTNLYFEQLVATMRHLPGVEAAAAVNHPPLGSAINRYNFCSDAHPEECQREVNVNPNSYHVTPGYFAAIRQPLLAGRDFSASDNASHHVAIINQALAAREWPGQSALGRRIHTGDVQAWATVVGVVGNVRNYDLVSAPGPDLYLPQADQPQTAMMFVLRTRNEPEGMANTVRNTIRNQHADLALYNLGTMEDEMAHEVAQRRFLMQVAVCFGILSLLIAVVGTYGLLAYEVSLREKEIGIRIALGSSREAIVQLLLRQEARWVLLGVGAGLAGAAACGGLLRTQFYQAQASALPVLALTALLLVLPSLVAIVLPARRAANLDPVQALRRE